MLNNGSSGDGGTAVNELVRVTANGSLNVRSGPNTSYSIVASVSQGTIVTRIRKAVANANGYIWDKIKLTNGTEGYVATDYLGPLMSGDLDYINPSSNRYYSNNRDVIYLVDDNVMANIMQGEQDYNTVSLTEEQRECELGKRQVGITAAGVAYATGMRDAGNNLLYFLTSGTEYYPSETGNMQAYEVNPYVEGHTVKELRFENAIEDTSPAKGTTVTAINEMMESAEKMLFATGQTETIYCHNEINGKCQPTNPNWYLAVYNYRTRNEATVTKTDSSKYTMTFKHTMIDYYDWEQTSGWLNYNPAIAAQTEFLLLNEYGLSKNYTNYDVLTYTVTWNTNQRIGTGATVRGPGLEK